MLGLGVLLWIPVSMKALAEAQLPGNTRLYSCFGYVAIVQIDSPPGMELKPRAWFSWQMQWPLAFDRRMLLPGTQRVSMPLPGGWSHPAEGLPPAMLAYREIVIPLWLVAGMCLAWPAIALVSGRLRDRRGFAVEGVAGEGGEG